MYYLWETQSERRKWINDTAKCTSNYLATGDLLAVVGSQISNGHIPREQEAKSKQAMKLSTLILAFVSLAQLGGSSANEATDIMRRQLRVGKAVASLFENQHQSVRDLQERIMQDEDQDDEVQVEPTRFRMRRLRSPNYVEIIE
ncbi:hypothetical protein PF001_g13240 [Phytophthora fragariae]|uniref:Uncharacterized protein n=1 Tax=Phytophthora fragariae TaxID=53985 RepID=A0A6A4D9V2_9STRA|nr:hypothetical protein PF001_g13240 [Phytophthora fragariae]